MSETASPSPSRPGNAAPWPDREPDNVFFPDENDNHNRGKSWKAEVYGFPVTIGQIEAGTKVRYNIESPELIIIQEGEVTVRLGAALDRGDERVPMYSPFVRNMAFGLPIAEIELAVPTLDAQSGSEPSDLIYTCFYPKNEQEQTEIKRRLREGTAIDPPPHVLQFTLPRYSDSKPLDHNRPDYWAGFELLAS